jgi:DNA-binding CsgD family transcriptional regulator
MMPNEGEMTPHADGEHFAQRAQRMKALREAGHTLQEIGEMVGVTRERVRQILQRRFGLTGTRRSHGPLPVDAILAYAQMHTTQQTADAFAVSASVVRTVFRRRQIAYPPKRGGKRSYARAAAMWAAYQAGASWHDLGVQFAVHPNSVKDLLIRYGYLHPPTRDDQRARQQTMIQMRREGRAVRDTAEALGVSVSWVNTVWAEYRHQQRAASLDRVDEA